MKRLSLILLLALVTALPLGTALATTPTCTPACPAGQTCQDAGDGTGLCFDSTGDLQLGGSNANANTAGAPASGASAAPVTGNFVPLTSVPGLSTLGNTPNLQIFLNTLYKLCIGAAASLAVLQLIRGGFTYMLGDSVTEKKEARHTIVMSVVGLLLVLSPYIVFSVIDPRILNLHIDVGGLKLPDAAGGGGSGIAGITQTTGSGGGPTGSVAAPAATIGQVTGTYLKRGSFNDETQAQNFYSQCTPSGYIAAYNHVDATAECAQTSGGTCTGTQYHSWCEAQSTILLSYEQTPVGAVLYWNDGAAKLSAASVPIQDAFKTGCSQDGGFLYVNWDNFNGSCPDDLVKGLPASPKNYTWSCKNGTLYCQRQDSSTFRQKVQ